MPTSSSARVFTERSEPQRAFRPGRSTSGFFLAAVVYLTRLLRAGADDHLDYRFAAYREDAGRISVETHTWLFEQKLTSWLSLKGEAVYDAISGATPTGAPPPAQVSILGAPPGPGSTTVPIQQMHDLRWAGSLDAEISLGAHRITPQFSYSSEHDYRSSGAALNYSLDLNEKNTTLNLGWAHAWDRVLGSPAGFLRRARTKDTDTFLIGVNQLLGPRTTLTVNLSGGSSHGYLNDQYRGVLFNDYPQTDPSNLALFGERRPSHRNTYIGYVALTHFVTPLNGSTETTYRFYHDTYGINAHTIGLAWHQKIGSMLMVSPQFRYYQQSAATFYASRYAGDPSDPTNPTPIPSFYSADYRLSHMETLTYGVDLTAKAASWLSFDAGYKRYVIRGLDGGTSQSAYPDANIFTVGMRLWF